MRTRFHGDDLDAASARVGDPDSMLEKHGICYDAFCSRREALVEQQVAELDRPLDDIRAEIKALYAALGADLPDWLGDDAAVADRHLRGVLGGSWSLGLGLGLELYS